jgi:hypothetical protein
MSASDRVFLHVVSHQRVDDDGLAGVFQRCLDVGVLAETLLFRFLHHDFAADQVFLDQFAQLWRIRLLAWATTCLTTASTREVGIALPLTTATFCAKAGTATTRSAISNLAGLKVIINSCQGKVIAN